MQTNKYAIRWSMKEFPITRQKKDIGFKFDRFDTSGKKIGNFGDRISGKY